jgi:taurine dioxygenase
VELVAVSPALGTLVRGVDLRVPHSVATWDQLRAALRRTFLLVFPGQDLDDDQHVDAVAHFGPIAVEGLQGPQRVMHVSNRRPDGLLGADAASFHIDYGFFPHPYEALSLYGLEVPQQGSETRYVNAVLAARTLPSELRQRLEGMRARHVLVLGSGHRQDAVRVRVGRCDDSNAHQVRPVLWPHRDTGEEILGVWEQQTDALFPAAPEESTELIELLFAHLYQPQHIYVHQWNVGDLVVWDNHAVQHGRPAIGMDEARTLRRVCVGATQDLSIFAEHRYS